MLAHVPSFGRDVVSQSGEGLTSAQARPTSRGGPWRPVAWHHVARPGYCRAARIGVPLPKARLIAGQGLVRALLRADVQNHGADGEKKQVYRLAPAASCQQRTLDSGKRHRTASMSNIVQN